MILLKGCDSHNVLKKIFRTLRGTQKNTFHPGSIHIGVLLSEDGEPVDEVLLRILEDGAEINAHGGLLPARKVLQALIRCGVRQTQPSPSRMLKTIEEETLAELEHVRTRLAACMLLDQLDGALSREISELIRQIEEVCLPSPFTAGAQSAQRRRRDEKEEKRFSALPPRSRRLCGEPSSWILERLDGLLRNAVLGRALVRPRRVVIVGAPNVGKSTLFNALVGRDRVITDSAPGTTRDPVTEFISIGGVPFILVDTAGMRPPESEAERLGLQAQSAQRRAADVLLNVFDMSRPLGEDEMKSLFALEDAKSSSLVVFNKADLVPAFDVHRLLPNNRRWATVQVSALTGKGIDGLEACIRQTVGVEWYAGMPVPFTTRQIHHLADARDVLKQGLAGEEEAWVEKVHEAMKCVESCSCPPGAHQDHENPPNSQGSG